MIAADPVPGGAAPPTLTVVMPIAEARGGAEEMLRQLVSHPSDRARWVVVFLEPGPMVAQFAALGVRTYLVPAGRVRQGARLLQAIVRLARILRRERSGIVVAWSAKAQLYASPAAALSGSRAVLYQLGLPEPDGWIDRIAAALPTAGVVVLAEHVAERQRRLDARRPVRLVPPGVDLARFDPGRLTPAEARAACGLPGEGTVVGIVGRLQEWKGIHTFLAAMPAVLASHPDTVGVVVGGEHDLEPEYPARLAAQIAELGLGERTRMVGLQTDVPMWMQAMDVIVHASDREPFGIVVLEAMALGKPVIAGSLGGPAEIVRHGVDGLLVDYEDADGLAGAIVSILADPQYAGRLGDAARRRAEAFSTERYAEGLTAAVLELGHRGR